MKLLITLILALFSGLNIFATAQYPDKIIYNGTEYRLHSNPLEDYFARYPDKRPRGGIRSTALWRGYVATFEIRDSQLFIKDIAIQYFDTISNNSSKKSSKRNSRKSSKKRYDYGWRSVLKEVFPDSTARKIDWLSGLLVIPYGELVDYVHMGYGSTYENYILLEIEKGNLNKEKHFTYDEYQKFKERQFKVFKQTEEYLKIKADMQKKGDSDEFIDSFLKKFIIKYTSVILTE